MTETLPSVTLETVARLLRIARVGNIEPWSKLTDTCREDWLISAYHFMRLLKECGVDLVRTGEATPPALPESPVISQTKVAGADAMRLVRHAAGRWEIVHVADGQEVVEQSFTSAEALVNAGLVLAGDPAARSIPALGKQLAALAEIHRLCATALEGGNEG